MTEPFRWEGPVDEGGLPVHLPIGLNEDGLGPEDDDKAYRYVCWCNDPDCALTRALRLAWEAGRRHRRHVCGGCQGLGSHLRHCRHNPEYTYVRELSDAAEALGDRIGPNHTGAANHCYAAAGLLREEHEAQLRQKDETARKAD